LVRRRRRSPRQRLLRHAERRLDGHPDHPGHRAGRVLAGLPELAGPGPPERRRPRKATAPHAEPGVDGGARRGDGLRDPRRRRAAPGHAPGPPEPDRVRDVPPARDRGAPLRHPVVPGLLLASPLLPGSPHPGSPDPGRHRRGPGGARARRPPVGRVGVARGRRLPGADRRRRGPVGGRRPAAGLLRGGVVSAVTAARGRPRRPDGPARTSGRPALRLREPAIPDVRGPEAPAGASWRRRVLRPAPPPRGATLVRIGRVLALLLAVTGCAVDSPRPVAVAPPDGLELPTPMVPPTVVSRFGEARSEGGDSPGARHAGIDMRAPTGTPVLAAADG